jgi:hypothetical protein
MKNFISALFLVALNTAFHAGAADLDIKPDTLNLTSKGKWVTAYITPPPDCNANQIFTDSLFITKILRGAKITEVSVAAASSHIQIGDYTGDAVEEMMVKFPRNEIQELIANPGNVVIVMEGICSGESFLCSDTIKAINSWPLSADLKLPASIKPKDITIESAAQDYTLNTKGRLTLTNPPTNPFMVIAAVDDIPVGFAMFSPQFETNSISCLETAVTTVMINSFLYTLPEHLIGQAMQLVRILPEITALSDIICHELSQRTDALVEPSSELLEKLATASKAANDQLAGM